MWTIIDGFFTGLAMVYTYGLYIFFAGIVVFFIIYYISEKIDDIRQKKNS